MASKPYELQGKKCSLCGEVFTKKSIGHNLTKKYRQLMVHVLVCSECKLKRQGTAEDEELENYVNRLFDWWPSASTDTGAERDTGCKDVNSWLRIYCPWNTGKGL